MLNFFNNIKKNDEDEDDVKEHYSVKYNPTGENDIISKIFFGLVILGLVMNGGEKKNNKNY